MTSSGIQNPPQEEDKNMGKWVVIVTAHVNVNWCSCSKASLAISFPGIPLRAVHPCAGVRKGGTYEHATEALCE